MKVTKTALPGLLLLLPPLFADERGFFTESFNARDFAAATGIDATFVQDNHSLSHKGVLRGLHYQLPPAAQGKLVRVLRGAVFDVAADLRKGSPTFGQWAAHTLSAENRLQLWIPEGFAHGFLALTDEAEVLYRVTAFYAPEHERTLAWNDPALAIDWPPGGEPLLSDRDKKGALLKDADLP